MSKMYPRQEQRIVGSVGEKVLSSILLIITKVIKFEENKSIQLTIIKCIPYRISKVERDSSQCSIKERRLKKRDRNSDIHG